MFQVGTKTAKVVSGSTKGIAAIAATALLIACGGRIEGESSADGVTSTQPTPVIGTGSMPTVRSGGGQTIKNPKLVPIYFGTDPQEAELTGFMTQLPGSDYWKQTTSEYGVGDLELGAPIHATDELPPTMSDVELKQWFITRFSGLTEFPVLDAPSSVYTIFLQPHTVVNAPWGRTCVDFRAYHGEAIIQGKRVVFAVIPRCSTTPATAVDALTRSISHELIEAVTDPFVDAHPAYALPDDRALGWALGVGSEVTDMCAFEPDAYGDLVAGRSVARSWSNRAASAGHDPCVPAVPGPYYNVEPIFPQSLALTYGGTKTMAKTIKVPVGESRTIDVMPFADGAIDSWTVDAQDEKTLGGAPAELELTFDDSTMHPGEARHLTIRRISASATGATAFVIYSHLGTQGHHFWGVVSN